MSESQEKTRAGFDPLRSEADSRGQYPGAGSVFRVLLGVFVFFLLLEFITSLGLVPAIYLPKASTVIQRMVELSTDLEFLQHVLATLAAWAVGLAFATLVSVPVGIV